MPPFATWRDAVAAIQEATGSLTPAQAQLAQFVGLALPENCPRLVAAARLQRHLGDLLALPSAHPCSEEQRTYIRTLETETDHAQPAPEDAREARAWIIHLRLKQRASALADGQLEAGDLIEVDGEGGRHVEEVASIGSNGRVYLTGGSGAGAWPDMVVVRCRKGETGTTSDELRREAANNAANRGRRGSWSEAKRAELAEYTGSARLTEDDVDQLERVIESAEDERPIQQYLQERRHLLASLLAGDERYAIPQVRLGTAYVADFLVAEVNSLGIRWVLVELETPRSSITLQAENGLDQSTRHGVNQVVEWREWLGSNVANARASRRDGGLGLFDIRAGADGLVLVGRRSLLRDNTAQVRAPIAEDQNIHVHTYDWLIAALRFRLGYTGIPTGSPFVI